MLDFKHFDRTTITIAGIELALLNKFRFGQSSQFLAILLDFDGHLPALARPAEERHRRYTTKIK